MNASEIKNKEKPPHEWSEHVNRIADMRRGISDMSLLDIEQILKNPSDEQKKHLMSYWVMSDIFKQIAKKDKNKGVEIAKTVPTSSRHAAFNGLFSQWAIDNFEEAVEVAQNQNERKFRNMANHGVVSGIAKKSPEKALRLADELNVRSIKPTIVQNWAHVDPAGAFKKRNLLKNNPTFLSNLFRQLARKDADKLAELLGVLKNAKERRKAIEGIITSNSDIAHQKLMETELSADEKKWIENYIFFRSLEGKPRQVAEVILKNGVEDYDINLISKFVWTYVDQDIDGATEFVESALATDPSHYMKKAIMSEFLQRLTSRSHDKGLNYALELGRKNKWSPLYGKIGRTLINEMSGAEIVEMLLREKNNEAAKYLLQDVYRQWAMKDIDSAITYSKKLDHSNLGVQNIHHHLGCVYSTHDAQNGGKWAMSVENKASRHHALEGFSGSWASRTPQDAIKWILSLPEGEDREVAKKAFLIITKRSNNKNVPKWRRMLSEGLTE